MAARRRARGGPALAGRQDGRAREAGRPAVARACRGPARREVACRACDAAVLLEEGCRDRAVRRGGPEASLDRAGVDRPRASAGEDQVRSADVRAPSDRGAEPSADGCPVGAWFAGRPCAGAPPAERSAHAQEEVSQGVRSPVARGACRRPETALVPRAAHRGPDVRGFRVRDHRTAACRLPGAARNRALDEQARSGSPEVRMPGADRVHRAEVLRAAPSEPCPAEADRSGSCRQGEYLAPGCPPSESWRQAGFPPARLRAWVRPRDSDRPADWLRRPASDRRLVLCRSEGRPPCRCQECRRDFSPQGRCPSVRRRVRACRPSDQQSPGLPDHLRRECQAPWPRPDHLRCWGRSSRLRTSWPERHPASARRHPVPARARPVHRRPRERLAERERKDRLAERPAPSPGCRWPTRKRTARTYRSNYCGC